MRTAIATLKSKAPYSQSRAYDYEVPMLSRERKDEYEERTWRNKCHTLPNGQVFIPPMAFKKALDRAAQMLSLQIPGKGKKTYTAFFLSGVLVVDPINLPFTKDKVEMDRIFASTGGDNGSGKSGKRVWRNFPRIDQWKADVPFQLLADEIGEDVFEQHLRQAGDFVGIGRFRPQNGGFYGRFTIEKIKWQ